MCVPPLSSLWLEIHPFVALSNDKDISPSAEGDRRSRRLRRAFEKARAKLSTGFAVKSPTNINLNQKILREGGIRLIYCLKSGDFYGAVANEGCDSRAHCDSVVVIGIHLAAEQRLFAANYHSVISGANVSSERGQSSANALDSVTFLDYGQLLMRNKFSVKYIGVKGAKVLAKSCLRPDFLVASFT